MVESRLIRDQSQSADIVSEETVCYRREFVKLAPESESEEEGFAYLERYEDFSWNTQ